MTDWNPDRYERFRRERTVPFFDLLALVRSGLEMRVVDLGCGTGRLTRILHDRVTARETIGVDSSPAMLARSAEWTTPGLRFELADLASFALPPRVDLVFSNAALHWVPDHPGLLAGIAAGLGPGAQLAVQVPANFDGPEHVVAAEVARELGLDVQQPTSVLPPERYAALLDELGFSMQHVRLQVYGHTLESRDEVVEWVRGTLLTLYEERLGPERFEDFLGRYRERLYGLLPDRRPFFFPFKRILLWAAKPA